jgi:hypothetical protein
MSQPILRYGFFGEDDGQKLFLKMYLDKLLVPFQEEETFGWRIKATNKQQVDARFKQAAAIAVELRLNVLFIGRDADTFDTKGVRELEQKLTPNDFQNQTLKLIPVQCIEHWLWYIKDTATKTGTLETQPRDVAKLAVWNAKKPTEERKLEVFDQLTTQFDIERLESLSRSFLHFHSTVKTFLKTAFS